MEKICIVNLRKKTAVNHPVDRNETCGETRAEQEYARYAPSAPPGVARLWGKSPDAGSERIACTAEEVSLSLTREQINALRTDPYLISFLRREFADFSGVPVYRGEPIILKVAWEPRASVRLLKSEDVLQMLRISKGFLTEIVRKGQLKSYKIGRRRRFRLDDVLSYLEDNLDFQEHEQPDVAPSLRDSC